MTTLLEASKQALEALENLQGIDTGTEGIEDVTIWCPEAIEALHTAISEAEKQRPPKCVARIEVMGKDWRLDYMSLPVGMHDLYVQEYTYIAPVQVQSTTCQWTPMDDDHMPDTFTSACGEAWSFMDGGPYENRVRYCHGCGKPVEVKEQS